MIFRRFQTEQLLSLRQLPLRAPSPSRDCVQDKMEVLRRVYIEELLKVDRGASLVLSGGS